MRLAISQLQISPKTRSLILWTERGAARHAKMLETDQAWEVFEKLEDCYFNQKSITPPPAAPEKPKHNAIITYYEYDLPVCNRPVLPGEILITFESYREIAERSGFMTIHYESLRSLSCLDFMMLADKADKHCLMWQKKMALV